MVRQALVTSGKVAIGKIAFQAVNMSWRSCPVADGRGMMAYTLRYKNEPRDKADYFRDIKKTEIDGESLELAEALIAKRALKFDINTFEDGYEVAVRELVDAKIHHLPVPKDEVPKPSTGKVINLMDALRKSMESDTENSYLKVPKKPAGSAKEATGKGIGLVKASAKVLPKRKSA